MRVKARVPRLVQLSLVAAGVSGIACGDASPGEGANTNTVTAGQVSTSSSSTTSGGATATQTSAATSSTVSGAGGTTGGSTTGIQGGTGGMGGSTSGDQTTSGTTAGTGGGGTGGTSSVDCNTGALKTRLPCQLSQTGLFAEDMTTLGEGVHPYSPEFQLWSDNAEKRRWIWLPPDSQIETSDMDYWSFPAGTKLWKEFSRDGTRVETRLIEKQESGTWYTVAYLWREDQTEADAVPDGMMNASGTEHDVPNADQCWTCHSQQPDKALGFSAVQLAHDPVDPNEPNEWTLDRLIAGNLLTAPPAEALEFSAGWPEQTRATLGYMHANCGTCHNPLGSANSTTGLDLWLKVDDLVNDPEESSIYLNIIDVDIMKADVTLGATKRIDPGSLENSAIYQRLITKGEEWSMPPLGTEVTDPNGQGLLEEFIMGL